MNMVVVTSVNSLMITYSSHNGYVSASNKSIVVFATPAPFHNTTYGGIE